MQFLRKIIDSSKLDKVFDLPIELRHKKVEVLILPIEDENKNDEKKFNPKEFRGILKIDNLKDDIGAIRNEWERH